MDRRLPTGSQPWIIGRRDDLALVTGSSFASFFYIFFFTLCAMSRSRSGGSSSLMLMAHIFATARPTSTLQGAAEKRAVREAGEVWFGPCPALVLFRQRE